MAEYIIRLEEGVKLSDICDIEDDGCVWINHHYANGLGETTPDTMAIELPPHGELIDRNELSIIGITDYKLEGHTVVEFEDVLNAPVILEATKKTDTTRKARICPHYQGVCGLDEDIVCYCSSSYEMCDKYKEASNG